MTTLRKRIEGATDRLIERAQHGNE